MNSAGKRRLAAISFLSNISLDGTYKDTGGSRTAEVLKDGYLSGDNDGSQAIVLTHGVHNGADVDYHKISGLKESAPTAYGFADSRAYSRGGSISNDEEIFFDARRRINTGGSEFSLPFQPRRPEPVLISNYSASKKTHFSSSESIDNAIITLPKGPNLSTTNISESSLEHIKEIKIVNMADVNPLKLSINYERLVVLVSHRSPWLIYSVLPYEDPRNPRPIERSEGSRRVRNVSGSRPTLTDFHPDPLAQLFHQNNEEVSYSSLIHPSIDNDSQEEDTSFVRQAQSYLVSRNLSSESGLKAFTGYLGTNSTPPEYTSEWLENNQRLRELKQLGNKYSPHTLDDSEFLAGKHRTLLTFSSYITSVIEYCKASDLKKELNDKFRDRFPNIQLTLSKLRSLKREMRKVAKTECNIDLLVVAQAYVYFEKLILKSYVTKANRKYCSGASLLLSAKLNDVKGQNLYNLIEVIERSFRVNRKDLFKYEFAVLIALEFSLHLPTWEVFPHYQRLLYDS